MASIANHPQLNTVRLQLKQNLVLGDMQPDDWNELESLLDIADYGKGDLLVRQGDTDMEQFFVLDGMLKRVVSNAEGHEMILRFAAETDMDTSYAAWRLKTPVPYSIVGVTKVRTAKIAMPLWVEFLDPECESCRVMHPYLKAILKEYEGRVHYILRYMPLHGNSVYAASMLEAAREQGKYWEALDALFEQQPAWADHHTPKPELVPQILGKLGLDVERLNADAKNPAIAARIEQDRKDGQQLGVRGTPTFFVNGRMLDELGDGPLRQAIESVLGAKL